MVVARVDIRARKRHVVDISLDFDISQQPDDRGQLEAERHRPDLPVVVHRDNLDLPLTPKRDRFLPVDDLEGLVRGVQKERLLHGQLKPFCPSEAISVKATTDRNRIVSSILGRYFASAALSSIISGAPMFRICATLLTLMTLVGCASTGAKPEPFPRPARGSSPHPAPPPAAPDAPLPTPTPTPTAESGAITSTALRSSGNAVSERRQRSFRLRLQRVRLVCLRPARDHRAENRGRTVRRRWTRHANGDRARRPRVLRHVWPWRVACRDCART